jgi:hypothetical protein
VAITIRPVGGLGNQLFIYATGSAVANKLGVDLWADVQHFDSNPTRSYMLDRFSSRVEKVIDEASEKLPARKSIRGVFLRSNRERADEGVLSERGFWFDPQILEASDGSTLSGYLQSWKYFHTDSQRLRDEILAPKSPSSWFLGELDRLTNSDPWIGVHVRRGDYLDIPRMGVASDFYYSRGLEIMERLVGKKKVVVFSDDIHAAKNITSLASRSNVEFFESPRDSCPLENLVLLSKAHHLIGANSSFSWWAGWLHDSEKRVVTYPRPWIDFRFINDRDLPLPHWIGLGRESTDAALRNHVGY